MSNDFGDIQPSIIGEWARHKMQQQTGTTMLQQGLGREAGAALSRFFEQPEPTDIIPPILKVDPARQRFLREAAEEERARGAHYYETFIDDELPSVRVKLDDIPENSI